jgi:DNA-binding response OmpR family regulator
MARNNPDLRTLHTVEIQNFEDAVRILVVEDDPLVREFVVDALRDEGWDVVEAGDGQEALSRFGQQLADVLVTDIRLPGRIDGWQIAESCREQDPKLPVIYVTGFSPVEARPVADSLTLHKPYHADRIVEAVRTMARPSSAKIDDDPHRNSGSASTN